MNKIIDLSIYFLSAVGIALILLSGSLFLKSYNLQTQSSKAQGLVISNIHVNSRLYTSVVEFETNTGEVMRFNHNEASDPPAYRVGENVKVLYHESTPQKARIDDWMSLWFNPSLLGIFGLILFLFGMFAVKTIQCKNKPTFEPSNKKRKKPYTFAEKKYPIPKHFILNSSISLICFVIAYLIYISVGSRIILEVLFPTAIGLTWLLASVLTFTFTGLSPIVKNKPEGKYHKKINDIYKYPKKNNHTITYSTNEGGKSHYKSIADKYVASKHGAEIKKLAFIRFMKVNTNLNLKEAKDFVGKFTNGISYDKEDFLIQNVNSGNSNDNTLSHTQYAERYVAAHKGSEIKKLDFIKYISKNTSLGLKESKEFVLEYLKQTTS